MDNRMNEQDSSRPVPRHPRLTPPHKVFFTWEVTYACNYNCAYCHAPKHGRPNTPETAYPGKNAWLAAWVRLRDDYGECEIVVSGGEPFFYPDFEDLAIAIAQNHIVEFTTNLYQDLDRVAAAIPQGRARFGTSFHPQSADLNEFIGRVKKLKARGFEAWTNFVPWPPFFPMLPEYQKAFADAGIKLVLQPFIGEFQGRHYPRGYTDDQKRALGIFSDEASTRAVEFKTTQASGKKGQPCRMGQNYAFIHPDGETDRCCKDKTVKLGNVITGNFRLLDEPKPCQADECNCWRCMMVATEPQWVRHWGRR
jgi:MoaA/NifB/PqqE/SkfB family radical SAM enzyme